MLNQLLKRTVLMLLMVIAVNANTAAAADVETRLFKTLTEENKLPPAVARCSIAADKAMHGKGNPGNPGAIYDRYGWDMNDKTAYSVERSGRSFSDKQPLVVDEVVTLRNGSARQRKTGQWINADFRCGIKNGNVLTIALDEKR